MPEGLDRYALVAVGSAAGGCARYAVAGLLPPRALSPFPWGTFVVNVTGCFVLGVFLTAAAERFGLDPRWRLLVAVGFCGGYTTFSALAHEASVMLDARSVALAALNVAGSFVAGVLALRLGATLAARVS